MDATPYIWEVSAFFALIGISRITQWLKQRRFFPRWDWLVKVKISKCGKHEYTKLKVLWLRMFNYTASALLIFYCLMQRYTDHAQVAVVVLIIEMNAAFVIEVGLKKLAEKNPKMAEIAKEGLYVLDDEKTVFTKIVQAAVGGGRDKTDPK
jgi:hypothetical protein